MSFSSQNLTMGQIDALVVKLGGEAAVRSFLRGELVVQKASQPVFPFWVTVGIGAIRDTAAVCHRLSEFGVQVTDFADDLLVKIPLVSARSSLDLVRIHPKEFGLDTHATTEEIYAAARLHGLSLCPPETAVQIALQYAHLLPLDESVFVAMEPIDSLFSLRGVFFLEQRAEGCFLDADFGHCGTRWGLDCISTWVFALSA